MSAVAMNGRDAASLLEVAEACKIVVLCEDAAARERAVEVFTRIAATFGGELEFSITCWIFGELEEQTSMLNATAAANSADIIMFSTRGAELPEAVSKWLDTFSQPNGKTGGALAFLLADSGNSSVPIGNMITRLAQAAQRLGMDFIPLMPWPVNQPISETVNEVKGVEWRTTTGRKELVGHTSHDHWGLNE